MGFSFNSIDPVITDEYITVRAASEFSGYNQQYLRRLLRENVFSSKRIGQMWLIDLVGFLDYLKTAQQSKDQRY